LFSHAANLHLLPCKGKNGSPSLRKPVVSEGKLMVSKRSQLWSRKAVDLAILAKIGGSSLSTGFVFARDFSEGLARVRVEEFRGGFYAPTGFIDRDGTMVIPLQF
jgi:hypothetical protein